MYPPPTGPNLSSEQAIELDDTYLSSDPFQFFRSRIAGLLAWDEADTNAARPEPPTGSIRAGLDSYLQRPTVDTQFRDLDIAAQVAAEALSIRQHSAETLVRFTLARLAPPADSCGCVWAAVSMGPAQLTSVIEQLRQDSKRPDAGDRFFVAVVPPTDREAARGDPDLIGAVNLLSAWLNHAIRLLSPAEIDVHAAHNKIKHGLAVRARADLKVVFTQTGPDEHGRIPASALNSDETLDIFDRPVLELLARGPKAEGHRQGLEVTQVRLDPAALLAEATMFAMAHGAMFHVAAVEHFDSRTELPEYLVPPQHPGYAIGGPTPEHVNSDAPLGMRFAITNPPGGTPGRKTALVFSHGIVPLTIDHAGRFQAEVTDN